MSLPSHDLPNHVLPNHDKPIIRRLEPSDAAEFKRLRMKGLSEHPDAFTSTPMDWDKPLALYVERIEAGHVFGGFDTEGRLLGHVFLATHAATGTKTRHKCEIWSVYVLPEHRGSGLARALLSTAIDRARDLGFEWVKLEVAEHNFAARKLYRSLGFIEYGREEDKLRLADGRSIHETYMQMRLNS
jgi:ribosomal protein S18 acetylase RimI-like enzyme